VQGLAVRRPHCFTGEEAYAAVLEFALRNLPSGPAVGGCRRAHCSATTRQLPQLPVGHQALLKQNYQVFHKSPINLFHPFAAQSSIRNCRCFAPGSLASSPWRHDVGVTHNPIPGIHSPSFEDPALSTDGLQLFLDACGAFAPLELELTDPDANCPRRYQLNAPFAVLGRHQRCVPRLDDSQIALRHLYVQIIAGRAFALKLGGDASPDRGRWLTPEHTIRFRRSVLRLVPGWSDPRPEAATPLESWNPLERGMANRFSLPAVTLEFCGHRPVTRWQVNRVLSLVGRQPPCKILLSDPSVSRVHCALLLTPLGLWAIDLLGRDGIWLDGKPVSWGLLQDGARLQVGCFPIRVWYQQTVQTEPSGSSLQVTSLGEQPVTPPLVEARANLESLGSSLPALSRENGLLSFSRLPFEPAGALDPTQQQMLAQFQQCLVTIAQTLTRLHQDQMDLLHRTVERMMRRQLRALRAELRKHASRVVSRESSKVAESDGPKADSLDGPRPKTPEAADILSGLPAQVEKPRAGSSPSPSARPGPSVPSHKLHAWLQGRMQALQDERQGLLKKILSIVSGGPSR